MDYSLFTSDIFDERYEAIPASLRAVFESEQTKRVLSGIEREHYLSPEKSVILEQLVGLTLMGFISLRNLSREVGEQLFLNFEHARVLTDEIYNRLLAPYEEEINDIYKPIEEVLAEKEQIRDVIEKKIEGGKDTEELEKKEEVIKPDFFTKNEESSPIKIETSEDAPLILQEEPTFFRRDAHEEKRPETPFNKFIPSSSESSEKKIPKAKIESGPNPFSFLKPEQKTTIHYNEIRTGLKPAVGAEEEVISVGALERMSREEDIIKPSETKSSPMTQQINTVQTPEVITLTPKTAQETDKKIMDSAVVPEEKQEKKSSWISNIFKNGQENIKSPLPEIKIQEEKPDSTQSVIKGNIINLK
ncbi:hypothetical protein C4565_00940 [Candidatus Parcubacteria bacterium]|jgi:hypothetical protein|nr:MAG: hypothetical protein C4565_00940 [Candidatus Parcubacteria bacterium]